MDKQFEEMKKLAQLRTAKTISDEQLLILQKYEKENFGRTNFEYESKK